MILYLTHSLSNASFSMSRRSDECKAAFPKKQAEVEVEKTPEMKKKADARRR